MDISNFELKLFSKADITKWYMGGHSSTAFGVNIIFFFVENYIKGKTICFVMLH